MTMAAIFDCDGVLVDSEKLALEVELAALAELGMHADLDDYMARCLGLTGPEWYTQVERDYFAVHNRSLPSEFRRTCEQRYRAAMASDRLVEVSGARAFVEQLACPKAVASSSSIRSLENKLRRTGLWDHFTPHVYSGEQVRHGKPEPDLFLHAASCLGIDPERCLVIEDSINGVRAARAAGMRVWGFLGGAHLKDRTGDHLLVAGAERILGAWADAISQLTTDEGNFGQHRPIAT
jgi:HAD superfamily hydrolase (TIGR01509 family)